ncbi:urease subunit alpha [Actinomycetospora sp. NBRC 106375]|uniref:urease subunit gamma n=1 Tax=Actinomycetospora sp. NBRC 106375 TaxID=3032207 RepID=UPI0024A282C2|nr:urease subunit gamma [Actinomycetospora sp. NBRC 106375]GLZ44562.1 urease subunit alpha [Actinomycetospora sp. NBRC 106375]
MHLTPREQERVLLHSAAELARRRLARGARLGAPEAIALVCDEICELAWDGHDLDDVVRRAREVVAPDRLVDGVAAAVPSVQVEALFPHGTTLVHVDRPFGPPAPDGPGAVRPAAGGIDLAPGRARSEVVLRNDGEQAVWVSSHVPLDRLNRSLRVDVSDGTDPGRLRLDIAAGTALRIEVGAARTATAVHLGGASP